MTSIVRKELEVFRVQLAEKNVKLEVTEACVQRLAEEGYSREFGARNAGRLIEDKIKGFFVDEVLFGRLSSGGAARVDWRDGEYRMDMLPAGFRPDAENGGDKAAGRVRQELGAPEALS
jgi:ATP-dependent Clp protease ATP-binding subunit ClpA